MIYLAKATESLLSAESEFVNGRYNSCANRCYYACFQAAIAALLREGIRPAAQWSHPFVQAQFVGVLINQRKRYDAQLRRVLADNQILRDRADYRPELVTATQGGRALRRTPYVRHRRPAERRCCPMKPESHVRLTPRMEEAVHELKGLITARFPQAAFVVEEGFDPEGIYLITTVDIADTDEVIAVVGDRLVELQVDEGLPVYVTPLRPIERVIAELRKREAATPPASLPFP